jgi:hypothetical protein
MLNCNDFVILQKKRGLFVRLLHLELLVFQALALFSTSVYMSNDSPFFARIQCVVMFLWIFVCYLVLLLNGPRLSA